MNNMNFINKIGSFYPINLVAKNSHNAFYIDYEKLPSTSIIGFYIVLTGLQIHKVFNVNLIIEGDDNKIIINTKNTINADELPEDNLIKEKGLTSGTFTISPKPFDIPDGVHTYLATAILEDTDGNIWDNATTWFVTRPDPSKN
ncbi:hypothetical protein G8B26_10895 [Limosilactobacillus reuteri]|nr:hypothetical protein G8B26_10895 [Limosilactobacillus reuteri]